MFKNAILSKFRNIFKNLEKQEETDKIGIYIHLDKNKEFEGYLFVNGKKNKRLSIDDITKLMG